jgi:hypothetical protein
LLGFQDGGRRLGDTGIPQVVVVRPRNVIILLFKLRVQLPVQGALREEAREDLLEGATTDPLDVLLVHRVAVLCCDEVVDLRTAWSTSFPSALLAVVANLS